MRGVNGEIICRFLLVRHVETVQVNINKYCFMNSNTDILIVSLSIRSFADDINLVRGGRRDDSSRIRRTEV